MAAKDLKAKFLVAVEEKAKSRRVPSEAAVSVLGIEGVGFRKLRLRDQTRFGHQVSTKDDVAENFAAEYLSLTLCDMETGDLLFPGSTGVLELQVMPAETLLPLLREAQQANGVAARSVEDFRKNSATIPADSSSSGSPAISGAPSSN